MKKYEIYNEETKTGFVIDEETLRKLDLTGQKHLSVKEVPE